MEDTILDAMQELVDRHGYRIRDGFLSEGIFRSYVSMVAVPGSDHKLRLEIKLNDLGRGKPVEEEIIIPYSNLKLVTSVVDNMLLIYVLDEDFLVGKIMSTHSSYANTCYADNHSIFLESYDGGIVPIIHASSPVSIEKEHIEAITNQPWWEVLENNTREQLSLLFNYFKLMSKVKLRCFPYRLGFRMDFGDKIAIEFRHQSSGISKSDVGFYNSDSLDINLIYIPGYGFDKLTFLRLNPITQILNRNIDLGSLYYYSENWDESLARELLLNSPIYLGGGWEHITFPQLLFNEPVRIKSDSDVESLVLRRKIIQNYTAKNIFKVKQMLPVR